jgi:hypothetical protein
MELMEEKLNFEVKLCENLNRNNVFRQVEDLSKKKDFEEFIIGYNEDDEI